MSVFVYRFLLFAYPAWFRRKFGAAMVADFADCYRDRAGNGTWNGLGTWRIIAKDLLMSAPRERMAAWRRLTAEWRSTTPPDVPSPPPRKGSQRGSGFDGVRGDVRLATRTLLRQPGFTAVAILTLALGIGANTAIFSVVHSVLLTPLPFGEPDQLVRIWGSKPDRGWARTSFTHANFWDFRDMVTAFEDLGAYGGASLNMTGFDFPEQLDGGRISAGFFHILRVEPVLGRTFLPGEDQEGGENRVVLLANDFWRTRFGGDPEIVGKRLTLNGNDFEVVGVLPAGEPWLDAADVFVPMVRRADMDRSSFELAVIGRMSPGVDLATARVDLERVARILEQQYPEDNAGLGVDIAPSSDWIAPDQLRTALWVLMGAVGLLLMIAAVNLANLLLARATGRAKETAVRNALGADRFRIARQALTESMLLGLAGAVVGVGLAAALIELLKVFDPGGIPRMHDTAVSLTALAFTLAVALLTSGIAGLAPAFQLPSADISGAVREGDRGVAGNARHKRVRAALVVAEVALSLMLLVGAGLLIRSFDSMMRVERGFDADNRLLIEVTLPGRNDGMVPTDDVFREFLPRVAALPMVQSVAAVNMRPIGGGSTGMGVGVAGQAEDPEATVPWADWRMITEDYFRTMGVPLLQGRTFTEQDRIGDPWRVIISESLAKLLWPEESALGREMVLWKGQNGGTAEIIGIVGDMRERGLSLDPTLVVYMPYYGAAWNPVNFVLHTTGTPTDLVPELRALLAAVDPDLPIANVETLDELVIGSVSVDRFNALLLTAFATVALLLALAGVYGVLAYTVRQRTGEIGVRLALGAGTREILRLVIRQGMRPVILGIALGMAGSVALSRYLESLLFGITPTDATTLIIVPL
ncbi:MAG: ABC transporter permease, partial [Acidobacteriota bacterium]